MLILGAKTYRACGTEFDAVWESNSSQGLPGMSSKYGGQKEALYSRRQTGMMRTPHSRRRQPAYLLSPKIAARG